MLDQNLDRPEESGFADVTLVSTGMMVSGQAERSHRSADGGQDRRPQ